MMHGQKNIKLLSLHTTYSHSV